MALKFMNESSVLGRADPSMLQRPGFNHEYVAEQRRQPRPTGRGEGRFLAAFITVVVR